MEPAREQPAVPAATRLPWDRIVGIAAVVVGLCALLVSWYTAKLQHTQIEAQIWPTLTYQHGDAVQGLRVINKGTGPALIGWAQPYVDGQPQASWQDALKRLDARAWQWSATGIETAVLSPGEAVDLVRFANADDYAAFRVADTRIGFAACYCSLLRACEVAEFAPEGAPALPQRDCEPR